MTAEDQTCVLDDDGISSLTEDELELVVAREEVADSARGVRDHGIGIKFVRVWNEIRPVRGEDMIEENIDPAGVAEMGETSGS